MEARHRIIDVTLVVDTAIYAAGDTLVATMALSNVLRAKNVGGLLKSLTVIDEADQKAAFDIYFLDSNVSFAAANAAAAPSDTAARSLLGLIAVATADYKDLGGVAMASYKNIDLILKPATDSQDVYIAIVNGAGTPTFGAATDLKLRLGVVD